MASIRIVLDPEQAGGLGEPFRSAHLDGSLIHLSDAAEVVVSGLKDGMQSGAPSVALGFVLPDGRPVLVETSWRLFASAFWALAATFGDEKPDATGMQLEYDPTGQGGRVRLDLVADDAPAYFECELCGRRYTPDATGEEGAKLVAQWVHRHFREHHPDWPAPA